MNRWDVAAARRDVEALGDVLQLSCAVGRRGGAYPRVAAATAAADR